MEKNVCCFYFRSLTVALYREQKVQVLKMWIGKECKSIALRNEKET